MLPVMRSQALPPHLLPDEVTAAQRQLRRLRTQGWVFWLMWVPLATLVGALAGLVPITSGLGTQFLCFLMALPGLAVLRMLWWMRQRPLRVQAHRDISRWRTLPDDERWQATVVLLDRIVQLSEHDAGLVDTAQRMLTMLFTLYEDISGLDRTIAADRTLEGDAELSDRFHRLVAIRTRRMAEIDSLINGLRDLHLELSEQPHIGPLQERMTEMMDRLEADREVAKVVGHRKAVLNRLQH